jgi:hypothetical protein
VSPTWARLPLLLATALLLIGGAVERRDNGSEAVLAAGLVVLGAWLAVEAGRAWRDRKDGD